MHRLQISTPLLDHGNKYTQLLSPLSPDNVCQYVENGRQVSDIGVRMEDAAIVVRCDEYALAAIADGHGSVPMCSNGVPNLAPIVIGGKECASIAVHSVSTYIKIFFDIVRERTRKRKKKGDSPNTATSSSSSSSSFVDNDVELLSLREENVSNLLAHAFRFAQRTIETEMKKGCRQLADPSDESDTPEDILDETFSCVGDDSSAYGLIDSFYFKALGKAANSNSPFFPYRIVGKYVQKYMNKDAVFYVAKHETQDSQRPRVYMNVAAEYGCTMTTVMVMPPLKDHSDKSLTVAIANAGDSDAYAFSTRRKKKFYKLTDTHSVENKKEVKRLLSHGMRVAPPYFKLGSENMAKEYGLQPSRSLGHTILSKHGITCQPGTSFFTMHPGEIIVLASDGLWSSYGACKSRRRGNINIKQMNREDLSAYYVHKLIREYLKGRASSEVCVDTLASLIAEEVQHYVPQRDNLSIIVIHLCDDKE